MADEQVVAQAPVAPEELPLERPSPVVDTELIPGVPLTFTGGPPPKVQEKQVPAEKLMTPEGQVKMTAKAPPEVGLTQSFFGAFNDAVLFLPDAGINTVMKVLESSGVIEPPADPRMNRDFLTRFFNAADYKKKEEILGAFNLGVPESGQYVRDPYAEAAGTGASLGAGFAGFMARAAQLPGMLGATGEQITQRMLQNPTIQNIATEVVRKGGELFRKAPVATTAAEVGAGAVGEALTEAEKEYTPLRTSSGQPIVTGAPALIGGVAASSLIEEPINTLKAIVSGIPILTYQLARKGYTFADGQIRELTDVEKAQSKISESMRRAFSESTQKAEESGTLPRTREIETAFEEAGVGAPEFSFAERTLDPLSGKTQTATQAVAGPEVARQNLERFENNIQKAFNFFTKMIPDAADSPMQVLTDRLTALREGIGTAFGEAKLAAQDELTQILSNFPALNQAQRIERGRAIQAQLDDMKQTAKDRLLALADELKLNNPQLRAQLGDLKAGLAERFKPSATTDDRLPAVIRDLRDLDANTMNFQDYRRFREDIGSALSSAAAKGGRGKEITDLEFAKKALDDWAENSFGPSYAQWRDQWMKEYVTPFENGLVYRLTERQFERPDMPVKYQLQGEMVADEIIKQAQRGKIDDFNQYIDLIKRDVPAMNNVRSAFLDDMLAKVYNPKKGEINESALKQYVNDNSALLNKLGMQDEVENITSATEALSQRLAGLKEREAVIKKDQLIKILDASAAKGQTTEEFVDELISSPNKFGTFWTRLKQPNEQGIVDEPMLNAFRSVVMNRIASTMDNSPDAFAEAMLRNAPVMKKMMTPAEFDKYMMVNDALHRAYFATANMAGVGVMPPSFVQELEKAIGTKLPSLGSYARAMAANKQSATFLGGLLIKNYLSAKHMAAFEEMQRKAIFDKEFIDMLAAPVRADGSVPPEAERRLRGYMFGAMIPEGEDKRPSVDVTYDPALGKFRRLDSGQPLTPGPAPKPIDRGVPAFENRTPAPVPAPAPVEVPTVAPVQLPQTAPEPAMQLPPLTITPGTRTPPVTPPTAPGRQGGLMYQNMFPNDPLGALLAAKRAG